MSVCEGRAREFIATYEFLKRQGENEPAFAAPASQRELAEEVSKGCDGAAKRFIHAMLLLERSGVGGADRVRLARSLALTDAAHAELFFAVFSLAFAKDGLDLDLVSSLRMAERLGLTMDGGDSASPKIALKVFRDVTGFCLKTTGNRGLDLSRPVCAEIATEMAESAARQGESSLGSKFAQSVLFLSQERGEERLSIAEAVALMRSIAAEAGATGLENFRTALAYAARDGGMKLSFRDSIRFAEQMAGR